MIGNVLGLLIETPVTKAGLQMIWQCARCYRHRQSGLLINVRATPWRTKATGSLVWQIYVF